MGGKKKCVLLNRSIDSTLSLISQSVCVQHEAIVQSGLMSQGPVTWTTCWWAGVVCKINKKSRSLCNMRNCLFKKTFFLSIGQFLIDPSICPWLPYDWWIHHIDTVWCCTVCRRRHQTKLVISDGGDQLRRGPDWWSEMWYVYQQDIWNSWRGERCYCSVRSSLQSVCLIGATQWGISSSILENLSYVGMKFLVFLLNIDHSPLICCGNI